MVTKLYGFKYNNLGKKSVPIWLSKNCKYPKNFKRGIVWWVAAIRKSNKTVTGRKMIRTIFNG